MYPVRTSKAHNGAHQQNPKTVRTECTPYVLLGCTVCPHEKTYGGLKPALQKLKIGVRCTPYVYLAAYAAVIPAVCRLHIVGVQLQPPAHAVTRVSCPRRFAGRNPVGHAVVQQRVQRSAAGRFKQ